MNPAKHLAKVAGHVRVAQFFAEASEVVLFHRLICGDDAWQGDQRHPRHAVNATGHVAKEIRHNEHI